MKLHGVLICTALAMAPWQAASAADPAMPAASMDCSTADTTMTNMMAMPMPMPSPAAAAPMSMDKNFAMTMHMMTMHGMQMAKLEAACGKDEKTRALAVKMMRDLQDYVMQLQSMLPNGG